MIVEREFSLSYIILDSIFLVFLLCLLFFKKKYFSIIFSLFGGILYFIVDYGIFHLATGSRSIENGDMFWTLLWMSMSYGITNFLIIHLFVVKDKHALLFSSLIWVWWICCPLLSVALKDTSVPNIHISRTTGAYHNYMALLLLVGYFGLIIYNLFNKDKETNAPIYKLFLVGMMVQFGWEFALLIGGIRSTSYSDFGKQIMLLMNNSILETNLGMPYLWLILLSIRTYLTEDLKIIKKEDRHSLKEEIRENNKILYKDIFFSRV